MRQATIKQATFATVTAASAGKGDEAEMVISTVDVDREGDRLFPEGADLAGYLKNPVVLYAHDSTSIPIGSATRVTVEPGRGLRARWRWLEGDEFADRVRNAWEQGMVRAASVGFVPRNFKPNEHGGYDITSWELVECSLVPVPANPSAVRVLKALRLLDGEPSPERVAEIIADAFERTHLRLLVEDAFTAALAKWRE